MTPESLDQIRLTHRLAVREAFSHYGPGRAVPIEQLYAADCAWHGPHPFAAAHGPTHVSRNFFEPLFFAFPDLERREDVSIAGEWSGHTWIAVHGYFQGLFKNPWLGFRPSGGLVRLRFGEFSRLKSNKIIEQYLIIDLLDLMRQLDCWPLVPALGRMDLVPGPREHDGIISIPQSEAESAKSLALVEAMGNALRRYDGTNLDSMEQWKYWTPNFTWYGPAGIGSCRGQEDYRRVHQEPFLRAWPDRKGGNHKSRIAEGRYIASTGWPSVRGTHTGGGFLGLTPTGRPIGMRVMDFWKRSGDLLDENWVLIDLLDLLIQMDFDVLQRLRESGELLPET